MAEDSSFKLMPYFVWRIKDISSTKKLKSPNFTVANVKFSMIFHQQDDTLAICMEPEVDDVPPYDIETSISIMSTDNSFKDFLFIHKSTNRNRPDIKESHLIWKEHSNILDNPDVVQAENGKKTVTFLCVFGSLSQHQKSVADSTNLWCEFNCLESLGKDLNEKRLKEDSSFQLKCGDKSLRVHEVILSARSGEFADKFRDRNMTENEIEIKDMEFEVLENFITYIYSGRLKDSRPSSRLLIQLYEIAITYKVEPLKIMTSSKLIELLNRKLPTSVEEKEKLPASVEEKEKLPASPATMDKETCLEISLELLKKADEHKHESFKKSIILSIIQNNDFILSEDKWKEFRKTNNTLAMEVYDILANEI